MVDDMSDEARAHAALGAAAGYCLLDPEDAWVIDAVRGLLDIERERGSA